MAPPYPMQRPAPCGFAEHGRNSGKSLMAAIKDLVREFEGTGKPIFVEVNPHHATAEAIVEEAAGLAALFKYLVINISATEPGFKGLRSLRDREFA